VLFGANQSAATLLSVIGHTVDWLIVDHYGIDRKWEKAMRRTTKKTMCINDLANRQHDCDLLLDHTLVLHASALPKGRGWSPHIWGIVQRDDYITLSLIEAEEEIDTGRIWKQKRINIPKYFYGIK